MNSIKYLDGIYNASLQIFRCSDKIKRPGLFASRKKKKNSIENINTDDSDVSGTD